MDAGVDAAGVLGATSAPPAALARQAFAAAVSLQARACAAMPTPNDASTARADELASNAYELAAQAVDAADELLAHAADQLAALGDRLGVAADVLLTAEALAAGRGHGGWCPLLYTAAFAGDAEVRPFARPVARCTKTMRGLAPASVSRGPHVERPPC